MAVSARRGALCPLYTEPLLHWAAAWSQLT